MIKRGIKFIISFLLIIGISFNYPSNALANMNDWQITGHIENNTGDWVYYAYVGIRAFLQGIHFSRHVDFPGDDHMATNDGLYYYYGFTGSFNNPQIPEDIARALVSAWNDYFNVW